MNPIPNEVLGRDRLAKESYEKPRVTTFGSVAKLTMAKGSHFGDGMSSKSKATTAVKHH
jgi:hypothetical protein